MGNNKFMKFEISSTKFYQTRILRKINDAFKISFSVSINIIIALKLRTF